MEIVKYLSGLAKEENIKATPLWLPPIPEHIFIDELEEKYDIKSNKTTINPIVGEYDDPVNQTQQALTIPFSKEGNCIVYGANGNGKTTFLTTLIYSLIKNHNANELNIYIMDFGSETLKVFQKAPQVGDFMNSSNEEKVINFLKMLQQEIEERKNIFSEFGGDYQNYCKNSGKIIPNILVVVNNYSGFVEQFENLQDLFTLLTRDGAKYGIYFMVSAITANAVRYKVQQNFKLVLTMQLNDTSEYSMVVGKTEGLLPSKYKGRGLVLIDRVYEFQTAYCKNVSDMQEYIKKFCLDLNANAKVFSKQVPVVPSVVNFNYVQHHIKNLNSIPVGVSKKELDTVFVNISNKVVYPIISNDIFDIVLFLEEFTKVVSAIANIKIIDIEKILDFNNINNDVILCDNLDDTVIDIFNDMVLRNNTYKDSQMNLSVLDEFEQKIYIIVGFNKLLTRLSVDANEKLRVLIEKAENIYKIHFIIVDDIGQVNNYIYDPWFKKHVSGNDGIWIGEGFGDQYLLKINKANRDLYREIGNEYGYVVSKNRAILSKMLSSKKNVEECEWIKY